MVHAVRHNRPPEGSPEPRCDPVLARTARMQRAAVMVAFVFVVIGLARWYIGWNSAAYSLKTSAAVAIDLNRDSEAAIELLPHVGARLAKRIVAERTENGPFADLPDLTRRVPGIGPKTAEVLRDHVAFSLQPER